MGWKSSTVIIHNPNRDDYLKILNELGFKKLNKKGVKTFEEAINPDINKIYIGKYLNNILITEWKIAERIISNSESEISQKLINLFPDSEICVIGLHSVVNYWGYSIFQNGKKLRSFSGSSDSGTDIEFGEPLEEEKEQISKAIINEDGSRTYLYDEGDYMTEDQVGEEFVFKICQRYFNVPLDEADDLLYETYLDEYTKNPWWKFWG